MLSPSSLPLETLTSLPERTLELHRVANRLCRAIYEKKVPWSARQSAFEQKMRAAYATVKEDDYAAMAWQRLVNHLSYATQALSIEPVISSLGPQAGNTGLDALLMLALCYPHWRQEPETWQPETTVTRRQIGSLARHLLTRYPVPAFLDAAWFAGFTPEGQAYRDWFVHIGAGRNIRRAPLPLRLTEKMAHHFLLAPPESAIVGALRWGQVHGMGGEAFLAQAVAESRMGAILPDETFWESVLHFFINHPEMSVSSVGPIVDFIYAQKFGDAPTLGADGEPDYSDAPEPTFSMKGRTLPALQKRLEEWHEQLAKDSKRPRSSWPSTGIGGLAVQEHDLAGTDCLWTVTELLNSEALKIEGRELKHCVFSYANGCLNGSTSIWSLRVRASTDIKTRRLLTIEVNNARRAIVQVRGKANHTLAAMRTKGRMKTAGVMLRRWAREQRLSVACGL